MTSSNGTANDHGRRPDIEHDTAPPTGPTAVIVPAGTLPPSTKHDRIEHEADAVERVSLAFHHHPARAKFNWWPTMAMMFAMPDAIPRWRPPHLRGLKPAKERAHYVSADWRAKRLRILVRDAYVCRSCRATAHGMAAHVDHIVPLEDGGTDCDANLQVLCSACHGRKTRDEQRRRGFLK